MSEAFVCGRTVDRAKKVRSEGKSKFKSKSNMVMDMLRVIHTLNVFDRVGVTCLVKGAAYGSVSRVFSELANSGYIRPTGRSERRYVSRLRMFFGKKFKFNYSDDADMIESAEYEKTSSWPSLMRRM